MLTAAPTEAPRQKQSLGRCEHGLSRKVRPWRRRCLELRSVRKRKHRKTNGYSPLPSASLSSQIWVNKSGRFTLQTRHSKFLHRPKRLRCHSAPLLTLLRSKSRRRRATRPAAGPPTPAIAGSRARGVTKATVRPPSLLNHSRRLASCCAPRHCRLSTYPYTNCPGGNFTAQSANGRLRGRCTNDPCDPLNV
jgi:hypothetical protein